MLINEVEHMVGLSKKSIRYYEENGLLCPKRNVLNDYRIYSNAEVQKLKKIKFLRDLGVSIRELKLLDEGKLSLNECIENQLEKIKREEEKYVVIKDICLEILESGQEFDSLLLKEKFKRMNVLGKEGFTMRDTKTSKTKKVVGAVLASVLCSLFFVFMVGSMTYFQFTEADKMPWGIYFFVVVIFAAPVVAMVVNLISRIMEILGGEEDEASKY